MTGVTGCHHVTIQTENLDRLIEFYRVIFGADVWGEMTDEGPQGKEVRHAFIDLGGFRFHAFEPPFETGEERGRSQMFGRGHIDHVALEVADSAVFDRLRRKLVESGASNGALTDWGPVRQIVFNDPDGMEVELSIVSDGELRSFNEAIREPWAG